MAAQGNYQRHGIDYDELVSSAMRLELLRTLLANRTKCRSDSVCGSKL